MEGYRWIGIIGLVFVGMTLINCVLGGAFVTTADVSIMNDVGLTQKVDLGFITLPVPNLNFISGLMHMLSFDYSFFGGMGQLIVFALYSITFMIAFALFLSLIGIGINAIRAR